MDNLGYRLTDGSQAIKALLFYRSSDKRIKNILKTLSKTIDNLLNMCYCISIRKTRQPIRGGVIGETKW